MTPSRNAQAGGRSILESPWLAAILALVVVILAGVLIVPGLLGGPAPSGSPGASSGAGGSPSPTPGPTFVRPTPSPIPTFVSHVVKSGDSLNSIARQYRTTARSIAWWNRGAYPTLDPESPKYDPNNLQIGWVLNVLPDTIVDDNNPPTPSPGPSTAAPQPTTAGPAILVNHGPRTVGNIALTFDMGGRTDPALDIIRWLIDHDVHATIFATGEAAESEEGRAVLQLAATRPDLFEVGNHSWDHTDFRELTSAQMAKQLLDTEAALVPIMGTTKPWFRPPYGGTDDAVLAGVGAAGWRYHVKWDIDSIDWRPEVGEPPGPTTAEIVAKVRANARGGSIVLMHLGGWNTLAALPGILDACGDLSLQPVTLTEMLA